jgi:hypothetical protein
VKGVEYLRIYTDESGCSHFQSRHLDLETKDYAPPAPPLNTTPFQSAAHSLFLELPIGWYGVWHPTPVRQWLIFMSGKCEIEVGSGQRTTCQPGDVVFLDDLTGQGHQSRVLGDEVVRIAAIHCN